MQVRWRARLADHLGRFEVDADTLRAGRLLERPAALEAVRAACQLALLTLPEREAAPEVYQAMDALMEGMVAVEAWPRLYIHWEIGLLGQVGFGLDLRRCALTGEVGTITHVSPKSGRGVNALAPEAEPYRDRLLPVPSFLLGSQAEAATQDLIDGLALSAHFLRKWVLWPADRDLPEARLRLVTLLERDAGLAEG